MSVHMCCVFSADTHASWLRGAYGVWRMAYGVERMAYGVWRVAWSAWRMAYGVWRMAYATVVRLAHGVYGRVVRTTALKPVHNGPQENETKTKKKKKKTGKKGDV